MPNLLAIPFKRTYNIDIKEATHQYIFAQDGAHPDEFKEDIKTWQNLRKDAVDSVVHDNRVEPVLLYHAQLTSILTKLPTDMQLEIAYAPAFTSSAVPITLRNLVFERASVLFNLAALYSQLGSAQDRTTIEGIKRAASYYQHAAGTLSYLEGSVLPKLIFSPDEEQIPYDLSKEFIKGLQWLMLAQAQECSWQVAKLNQSRNSNIAKIAAAAASMYHASSVAFRESSTSKSILPSDWLSHVEAKEHHFWAVAEYRESIVEYEASRYGVELGRLAKAQNEAKKAYDIARRGKVTSTVVQDAQSLLETVKSSEARAQRDNDLIYHQDVPAPSALSAIQEVKIVSSLVPKGLANPVSVIGDRHQLFSQLASWGAREAINIYNDRKQNLIKERILDYSQELQDQADEALRKLNLPSSLEALERPIGLPPSLLRKAEEVRLEDGPAKIQASIEDVERLAHQDLALLEEALDILDSEASEDEAARKQAPLTRLRSHEANIELIEKANRYRDILSQASESDESVQQKWYEGEESITALTWDEEVLEAAVPSTTVNTTTQVTPQGKETRMHAQALRVKLEELDTLHRDRDQLVHRAQSIAANDDIQPRIMKASSGFERLAEVTPAMFEDVSDEELAKYDKFLSEMGEIQRKQQGVISQIQNLNKQFLDSRKDDPTIKEREEALQFLDLAYFKYREITRNLDEGFQFYNDLAGILVQFKEVCKTWSLHRNQELHPVARSMQSMSLREKDKNNERKKEQDKEPEPSDVSQDKVPPPSLPKKVPQPRPSIPSRKPLPGKSALGLPAINSSEWEFEELVLPPGPKDGK